ncbi:MAG TPA: hypothetical protein VFE05_02170 [Longimicrobiaceae bacterium]|jgi:hypothetical protein|nr:hypothetical protein [Longimicrobiaceae bacterium]
MRRGDAEDGEMARGLRAAGATLGASYYVHLGCLADFMERVGRKRQVVQPDRIRWFGAAELVERRDVYACDQCHRDFHPADEGCLCLWVTTPAELAGWLHARFHHPG